MAFGRLKVDQIETSTQIISVDDLTASNGISDGDKGDITVASGGTVWTVNNGAVSYNELANLPSFTGPVVAGRESGTGDLQGLTLGAGLSISGGVLSATVSGSTGGVTSVGLVAPSGFAVAGSPVTSSGSIALSFAAGYSLPTTASQANWDTAYSERLYWDGDATGLNAVSGRASLGLGNSATLNVGTTAGTVAAGDALGVHVAAADPHPNYALESSLATVATTGAYSDLTGKPVIPAAADALPQNLGAASIGISTDYAREDHIHAMPSAGDVGADPVGTSASGISAHEAAADPHPGYALETSLATVATTGSYADLSSTPTFTGPIVAGRASGTGALESLTLGEGLSIVGSQLTVSSSGTGTVTSVGLVVPSGFAVSNSPITSAGDITVVFASGYSLPTTVSQADWDTAYSERLYWDGGATGLNAASGRTSLGLATVASTGAYSDLAGTPVIPSGADATPQALGVAAVGVSADYAREDHVHTMPSAGDVGADPAGTAASGITAHEAAADPHPGYALESSLGDAALLNVGTASGTVAAGDDSRFVASGGTTGQVLTKTSGTDYDAAWATPTVSDVFVIACSDETSNLTAGTNKARFTMPYAGTLTAVKADVNTAPTGSTLVVDINEAGVSVLSTKLSIDAGETSSSTAAAPAVISDSALANGAVIGIDIDQIGSTVAGAGLKVTLYVTRS